MLNQQTIKCDVKACRHHGMDNNCKLAQITVTCDCDCKTAHYCQDYECCDDCCK